MGVYHKGYVLISDPEQPVQEYDSFVCCHRGEIVIVERSGSTNLWSPPEKIALIGQAENAEIEVRRRKSKRTRGFCFRCMKPTCGRKACVACVPFEARMEAQEGSRRFWKQIELVRS